MYICMDILHDREREMICNQWSNFTLDSNIKHDIIKMKDIDYDTKSKTIFFSAKGEFFDKINCKGHYELQLHLLWMNYQWETYSKDVH